MELKKYQKTVLKDLTAYLAKLQTTDSLKAAYSEYWEERGIAVNQPGVPGYQNVIASVPHVCYKVPTGGGKTYLGCASIRPIFNSLTARENTAVVWLVPSDAILAQTIAALKDPQHPYRQRLSSDFAGRVEVYSKEDLLSGQNFSPATVSDQLSVMVLSYDSFRSSNKEGRKAYQANGNLASFHTVLGDPSFPIEGADNTSLIQVVNQLNPIVIVDESHHATSTLSLEMLRNFNPSFVLDLTATPKSTANIISYVGALALKREHMVKLPVIAYNRSSQEDVIADAITLREALELAAAREHDNGGSYIRPIVLFQAQPKTHEDSESFEKLRAKLVKGGLPEDQIAIKTANKDELKGVDLLSEDCNIRYIITVNALKEGWDCPFAYVLASLANKSSAVDVEQILGRVLRQPNARKHEDELLNLSYVLTSSSKFHTTLGNIVTGLNRAGFTARDYRVAESLPSDIVSDGTPQPQPSILSNVDKKSGEQEEDFLGFSEDQVQRRTEAERDKKESDGPSAPSTGLTDMLRVATTQGAEYERDAQDTEEVDGSNVPDGWEVKISNYPVQPGFVDEAASLQIPQFVIRTQANSLFDFDDEETWSFLEREHLTQDFSLRGASTDLSLDAASEDMYRVDIRSQNEDTPRAFRISGREQAQIRKHLDNQSTDEQIERCASIIVARLDRDDTISSGELRNYVEAVVRDLDQAQRQVLVEAPWVAADAIRKKIKGLAEKHRINKFEDGILTQRIKVEARYTLPESIRPNQTNATLGGSLYVREDAMGPDEEDLIAKIYAQGNIRWWHRIIARKGFVLNGAIHHYPDFMVMTNHGNLVLIESKGAHLVNPDTIAKIKLGQKWALMASQGYHYLMVFKEDADVPEGGRTVAQALELIQDL